MRPKAKREVRREEESSNPVDTGASTSNNPKIRVLNHKDYKTWKVRIPSVYTLSSITAAWLAHLVERQSTVREVEGSSPRPDQHSGS